MKRVHLGCAGLIAVSIDVEKLRETRLLIQGGSGSGKSHLARKIVEGTNAELPTIVIEGEGEWSTLRPKFPFIVAGPGDDCPAEPRSAEMLARKILELGASAVINLHDVKEHDRHRIVRLFTEALMNAPRSLRRDYLVVVEEAQLWAPQAGRESEASNAIIDLATRGRKRGLGLIAVTLRVSDVAKSVIAQCQNVAIGRTTLDTDVKRSASRLGFESKDGRKLLELARGEFFVHGPAFADVGVLRVKVEDTETKPPKMRGPGSSTTPAAPEAIKSLVAALAAIPKEAEAEAKTVDELRARVRELERSAKAPAVDPAEVTALKDALKIGAAYDMQQARRIQAWRGIATEFARHLRGVLSDLDRIIAAEDERVAKEEPPAVTALKSPATTVMVGANRAGKATAAAARRENGFETAGRKYAEHLDRSIQRIVTPAAADGDGLTGPEQRIVDAIAWLEATNGRDEQLEKAVAFLANYTVGGGAFNNPKGRLRARGLIDYKPGKTLALTPAGRELAVQPDVALTPADIQNRALGLLPGPEAKLLRAVLDVYPEAITNEDLARRTNYEPGGGAFNNPRGRLKSLGLVEYPGRGEVRASRFLFLQ